MKITAKAVYEDGRLIFHNPQDIPEDGSEVIVSFERQHNASIPLLRDSWAKYFPEEINLDEQLKKIRREWESEMEELDG